MSHRAIQRLRKNLELTNKLLNDTVVQEEKEKEEEDEEETFFHTHTNVKKSSVFVHNNQAHTAAYWESSSSSSSDDDEEEEDDSNTKGHTRRENETSLSPVHSTSTTLTNPVSVLTCATAAATATGVTSYHKLPNSSKNKMNKKKIKTKNHSDDRDVHDEEEEEKFLFHSSSSSSSFMQRKEVDLYDTQLPSPQQSQLVLLDLLLFQAIQPTDFNIRKSLLDSILLLYVDDDNNKNRKKNTTIKGYISFKNFLFGDPQQDWLTPIVLSSSSSHVKRYTGPPTFISGGIGFILKNSLDSIIQPNTNMTTTSTYCKKKLYESPYHHYFQSSSSSFTSTNTTTNTTCSWYTFIHSQEYQMSYQDLQNHTSIQIGNHIQTLCLFLADYPYCTHALYLLANFCLQTLHLQEEGFTLLLRILYIYECAIGPIFSFLPPPPTSTSTSSRSSNTRELRRIEEEEEEDELLLSNTTNTTTEWKLFNHQVEENKIFLQTLFRLIQVITKRGCIKTALAISRLLFSFDPLCDPFGVLLIMDSYALKIDSILYLQWIVQMVESNCIVLYHTFDDDEYDTKNHNLLTNEPGFLLDLPNWAYSYALALFRLEQVGSDITTRTMSSKQALIQAIQCFPKIPLLLLGKNSVDIYGRSCKRDWSTILSQLEEIQSFPLVLSSISQQSHSSKYVSKYKDVLDRISTIYISQCYKCWGTDDILPWFYDACVQAVETSYPTRRENSSNPFVLIRYLSCNLQDFQDTAPFLPAEEANIVDPATLALALRVDPHHRRGRHLQTRRAGRRDQQEQDRIHPDEQLVVDGMGIPLTRIDPDLPLVEIFWRSLMPWSRVNGVRR